MSRTKTLINKINMTQLLENKHHLPQTTTTKYRISIAAG